MPNLFETGISVLDRIIYLPGQTPGSEDAAILPVLAGKVRHGISIGPGSANMAEFFDKDNIAGVIARQERFLKQLNVPSLKKAFLMLPPRPGEPQIIEITPEMVIKSDTEQREDPEACVRASAFFTSVPERPLLVKPADCPSPIVYARNSDGIPILGVWHGGRVEIDNKLPERAAGHLLNSLRCDPKDVLVGIPPGISQRNYFVRPKDQLNKEVWKGFSKEQGEGEETRIYLDLLGNLVDQLIRAGILSKNIQAYGPDICTYELAAMDPPLARSQRYSTATNQRQKNGRFLVAACL